MTDLTREELAARGLRVRELVWQVGTDHGTVMFRASGAFFHQYTVSPRFNASGWIVRVNDYENYTRHDDENAAKEAAQSDFTARILAALEPTEETK